MGEVLGTVVSPPGESTAKGNVALIFSSKQDGFQTCASPSSRLWLEEERRLLRCFLDQAQSVTT